MFQEGPKVENDRGRPQADGSTEVRVFPSSEQTTYISPEAEKELRFDAFYTYSTVSEGIKLRDELRQVLNKNPENEPKGSVEYFSSCINHSRIQKSIEKITEDLIIPEVLAEELSKSAAEKNLKQMGELLKSIGDYKDPQDPRLSQIEIGQIKDIYERPWFEACSEVNQGKILANLFIPRDDGTLVGGQILTLLNDKDFLALGTRDQQGVVSLVMRLGQESIEPITQLLKGKIKDTCPILNRDFSVVEGKLGNTLLSNLINLSRSKLIHGTDENGNQYDLEKDKIAIVNSFIKELADFSEIAQATRGTCAPTTPHHYLAWMAPAELTRLYTELITKGKCKTYGRNIVKLGEDAIPEDNSGRSLNERIMTTALLNDAAQKMDSEDVHFLNSFDGFLNVKTGKLRETGQTNKEYIYTCESLLGKMSQKIEPSSAYETLSSQDIEKAIGILRELNSGTANPEFTAISIRWPSSGVDKKPSNHAVLALGVIGDGVGRELENERLLFRNPHGSTESKAGTFISLDKEGKVNVRVENPKLGVYSIPLDSIRLGGAFELGILMKK